jgi:hypothetical protein
MKLLAIRLSPQAGKSLVIRRRPESSQDDIPAMRGELGVVGFAGFFYNWIPACAGMTCRGA